MSLAAFPESPGTPGTARENTTWPNPYQPFVWFSRDNGRPVEAPPGSRIPAAADYWWQPGLAAWVKVERPAEAAGPGRTAGPPRWDPAAAVERMRAADEVCLSLGPAALRDPRVKAAADRAARAWRRCDRAGVLAACEDLESHARRAAEGRESS